MSTTADKVKSQEKKLFSAITARDLNEFLAEDDEGQTKLRRLIDKAYETAIGGNPTLLVDLLNRAMGKPKESLDVTSGGEKVTAGLILYGGGDVPVQTP